MKNSKRGGAPPMNHIGNIRISAREGLYGCKYSCRMRKAEREA